MLSQAGVRRAAEKDWPSSVRPVLGRQKMAERFSGRALTLTVCAMCCLAGRSHAASVRDVIVGSDFRSWTEATGTAQDISIHQNGGLLTVGLGLTDNVGLVVSNSGASSKLGIGSSNFSLAGLSSFSSALVAHLVDDRLLLKLTATAPSGKRNLDSDELEVVGAIGRPLLGFGVRHYGTGFEGGGSATWCLIAEPDRRVSVGVGGLMRGPYRLFEGADDFHPASEWAATGGASVVTNVGLMRVPILIDLTYRGFGTDRWGSADVFKEGEQIEFQAQGLADAGPFHWNGVLRSALKSANATLEPSGSAIASFKSNSGSSVAVLLGMDHDWGPSRRLGPVAEFDLVTGSEAPGRNGSAIGLGPHGRFDLGSGVALELAAQYWWGSIDALSGGARDTLHGASIELTLRWTGSR
jgi:hypothetical protein